MERMIFLPFGLSGILLPLRVEHVSWLGCFTQVQVSVDTVQEDAGLADGGQTANCSGREQQRWRCDGITQEVIGIVLLDHGDHRFQGGAGTRRS